MKEYIERTSVHSIIEQTSTFAFTRGGMHERVDSLPTADVVEVRHGRWAEYDGADKGFHYCSECKGQAFNYEENGEVIEILSGWCPNCGARMDKEDEHEAD